MDLFSRFKKDYLNYLVSIVIPVIITSLSIPLFKQILGAEGYGNFSITFNSVLLCTAILSGWIWPSILRYFPSSNNKKSFTRQAMLLSVIAQSIFFLPVLLTVWYLKADFLTALFFALALFITSLQFSLLALGQSVFLSKKSIRYELIRAVTYITSALLLLKFTGINYMYSLFSAIIFSYLLSFIYLLKQIRKKLSSDYQTEKNAAAENLGTMFKQFISYGGPLALWFVFASLITLIDKFFILNTLGAEVQGNYQAMFDFLSKSITIIITPIIISLFPLLTAAFEMGQKDEIKRLLIKIILFETAGLVVAMVCYWWFGAAILFSIIHIPDTFEYKLTGLIVIAATFIYQIAMVVQKKFELLFKNRFLFFMLIAAFSVQMIFYFSFNKMHNQLIFPAGYLLATSVYLILISFSDALLFIKKYQRR